MMENTKKLFYSYNNKYAPEDMPEVKTAIFDLNEFLEKNMTPEQFSDAEEFCSELCIQSEMQGFVHGFQYAMKIAAECWVDLSDHKTVPLQEFRETD